MPRKKRNPQWKCIRDTKSRIPYVFGLNKAFRK